MGMFTSTSRSRVPKNHCDSHIVQRTFIPMTVLIDVCCRASDRSKDIPMNEAYTALFAAQDYRSLECHPQDNIMTHKSR